LNDDEDIPRRPERAAGAATKIIETATGLYGIPDRGRAIDPVREWGCCPIVAGLTCRFVAAQLEPCR